MRTPACVFFATLAVLACEGPEPGPQLVIRMDSTAYGPDPSGNANVGFTIGNLGTAPAFIQRCCDHVVLLIDTLGAGHWGPYLGGTACPAICSITVETIQPGDSTRGSFSWDRPATYRVRILYGSTQSQPAALQRPGAAFTIR